MRERLRIIDKWLVGISLLILLLSPVFYFVNEQFQLILCISLLIVTGIPHGALDHIIFHDIVGGANKRAMTFGFLAKFVLSYLLCFLAFMLLWFFSPLITLLVFLVISAYHFGESQLFYVKKNLLARITYFVWGSILLLIYLISHQSYAEQLISSVIEKGFLLSRSILFIFLVFNALMWLTLMIYQLVNSKQSLVILANEVLVLGIITLIFACLPPLFSFMIYFALWHAFKVFYTEYIFLKNTASISSIKELLMASMPFSILAIIGLAVFVVMNNYLHLGVNPVMVVIIGISAMTLPHAAIMQKMYSKFL